MGSFKINAETEPALPPGLNMGNVRARWTCFMSMFDEMMNQEDYSTERSMFCKVPPG